LVISRPPQAYGDAVLPVVAALWWVCRDMFPISSTSRPGLYAGRHLRV